MILKDIAKNKLRLNTLPGFCTFLVTWRCNARCQMCSVWQKTDTDEMTIKQIEKIFGQHRFDAIRLSGGEPFLRDDIADIIRIIQNKNRPQILHITTNGILTEKITTTISQLEKIENLHIKISIDSVGEKHDKTRGIIGAFDKAMQTLKNLADLRKKKGFYLGVNQTISDQNGLNDHYELKKMCDDLGVKLHVVIAYKDDALYATSPNLNKMPKDEYEFKFFYEFSDSEIQKMIMMLKKEAKEISDFKEKIIKKYYLRGFYNRVINKIAKPNPRCLALQSHLRINPNGDVPICLFNSNIVGNLKNQTIKEVWSSANTKSARQLVHKCPGCWVDCEVVPSAIYTGDIFKGI